MKINTNNDSRDDRHVLSCAWREIQSVPTTNGCPRTRFKHAACIHGNHVYIFSGKGSTSPLKDIWRYHLGIGKWERLTYRGETLPHLEGHTVVSHKRLLLIFGGEFSTCTSEPPLWIVNTDHQYIHRPCGDNSVPQPTCRRDHSALLHCGIMYIFGGFVDLRGSSSELWGYHIDDDYWKLYTPLSADDPGGRHGHSCVEYHNNMWIFGGLCDLTIKSELWAYNFLNGKWQKVKCLPCPPPMTGHSADVIKEQMVVIGGENQGELYRDIWLYGFEVNIWRKITLHNSPHQPLPCSQHATVCIMKISHDESGEDNSARCFSEPALQGSVTSNLSSISNRPRTSPSTESNSVSASKWVYPVKSASRHSDVLSLEVFSVTSVDTARIRDINLRKPNERKISAVSTVEDDRPLLRFVSRDSTDSIGIDNVIDCTSDERDESRHELSKMCSTTGLSDLAAKSPSAKEQHSFVNNLQHDFSVSIGEGNPFNIQDGGDKNIPKPNSLMSDWNSDSSTSVTSGRLSYHRQDITFSGPGISSASDSSSLTDKTFNQKTICSRYCNDLFIEDIEQEQQSSPEKAKVANPFTFTKEELSQESKQFSDWVELDSFPPSRLCSDESRSRSADDPSGKSAVMDRSSGTNTKETCLEKPEPAANELALHNDHDPAYSKVLVTVATQTGSNLDLRPENETERKNLTTRESELFLDGAPFLLMFGGKVNKGHLRQQPIKVWRCDINI